MKKLTLIIGIGILFGSWIKPVDIGVPSINSICKIRLTSGEIKEGILCIVNGGYEGYRKNGFGSNYPDSKHFGYELFSVTDYSYGNGGSSRMDRTTGERQYPNKYFMASQYDGGGNQTSTLNDTTMEHSITLTTTYKYKALKQFHIYEELPLSLYFPREGENQEREKLKKTIISVDEIDRFELISKPSEKWLTIVRVARERRHNSNDAWEDYQEPLWFHEIRTDSILFNNLKIVLGGERVPYPCQW